MGTGEFIMSERSRLCQKLPDFQLIGHHQSYHNPDVSYLMWIELRVFLPGKVITTVKIGKALQIWVNGSQFYAGKAMPHGIHFINTLNGVVETTFGVVVQFNGIHEGTIWIPPSYNYCVEGLCGNADYNRRNDWVNQRGIDCGSLSRHKKYWCVGNSWHFGVAGHKQTVDREKLSCSTSDSWKFGSLCYCGALRKMNGPFSKCLQRKPTVGENSYTSCMFDTCANKKDAKLAKKLACENVEAFAKDCGNLVHPNWRYITGCLCPGELVWTTCGRNCTRTCQEPSPVCPSVCVAKCQCPRSRPFQQGHSCLDMFMCTAYHFWEPRTTTTATTSEPITTPYLTTDPTTPEPTTITEQITTESYTITPESTTTTTNPTTPTEPETTTEATITATERTSTMEPTTTATDTTATTIEPSSTAEPTTAIEPTTTATETTAAATEQPPTTTAERPTTIEPATTTEPQITTEQSATTESTATNETTTNTAEPITTTES
ncbi:hypothetical protein NP493_1815g00003 [Ridgeia piscesae]|uniref:VWFD domain-containing protein n=1 Tax=Ridgeia piscesae TaxID=27915 RepID=A0AAD9JSJ3_RIDPI|nr:hypothetical protein NP493_1815g00003 [Ridgeia piscesae]